MSLKFSQEIKFLLEKLAIHPVAIAEILQATAETGFSLIIGLLVLPFLFPMPPGVSTILGSTCLLLSIQMALGRKVPWLPRKIARFKFPRSFSRQLLSNVAWILARLEKIVRPRWKKYANNAYTWRVNGICIAWLSVLLMLPIPFTNPVPAIAILLLAVATSEADGLLMFVGYIFTAINTVFFGFIGYALWQAPHLLPNIFR
jgi:hypothetical protein